MKLIKYGMIFLSILFGGEIGLAQKRALTRLHINYGEEWMLPISRMTGNG